MTIPVRRPPRSRVLLVTLTVFAMLSAPALAGAGKDVFGWAENVVIKPGTLELHAKLDTGADTSSLDATQIRRVRRGEERFIRFTLVDPSSGETLTLLKPLLRRVTIKRHDGDHQRRPVVAIDLCLGGFLLEGVEVSLIDRSQFNFPLLLGRSALEGIAVIDPELSFTRPPSCELLEGAE